MKKLHALYCAAAAATAVGGIMHLIMSSSSLVNNLNTGILFLVGGIVQLFWVVPMVRRWGLAWYSVGIGGTTVFVALWVITRIPENPITGRGGPVSQNAIIVEAAQMAFIALAAVIIACEKRRVR